MYLYKPVFLLIVNDHIIVGADARSEPWTNVYDPLVAMSFVAAHTSRIGVGVSVLIMPYRNPIATAKALATIDLMSGARLTVGRGLDRDRGIVFRVPPEL